MRIAIDLTEAVNGYRVDILDDTMEKTWKENPETRIEALQVIETYINSQITKAIKEDHLKIV